MLRMRRKSNATLESVLIVRASITLDCGFERNERRDQNLAIKATRAPRDAPGEMLLLPSAFR